MEVSVKFNGYFCEGYTEKFKGFCQTNGKGTFQADRHLQGHLMRQLEPPRKPRSAFVSAAGREQRICCNSTKDLFRWVAIEEAEECGKDILGKSAF